MTVLLPPRNIAFMIVSCSSTDPCWLSFSSLKYKLSLMFTNVLQTDYFTQKTRNLVEDFDTSTPSPMYTLEILHTEVNQSPIRSTASKLSSVINVFSLSLSP